jgi:hypothetical protein
MGEHATLSARYITKQEAEMQESRIAMHAAVTSVT